MSKLSRVYKNITIIWLIAVATGLPYPFLTGVFPFVDQSNFEYFKNTLLELRSVVQNNKEHSILGVETSSKSPNDNLLNTTTISSKMPETEMPIGLMPNHKINEYETEFYEKLSKASLICNAPEMWRETMAAMLKMSSFLLFIFPMVLIVVLYVRIWLVLRSSNEHSKNKETFKNHYITPKKNIETKKWRIKNFCLESCKKTHCLKSNNGENFKDENNCNFDQYNTNIETSNEIRIIQLDETNYNCKVRKDIKCKIEEIVVTNDDFNSERKNASVISDCSNGNPASNHLTNCFYDFSFLCGLCAPPEDAINSSCSKKKKVSKKKNKTCVFYNHCFRKKSTLCRFNKLKKYRSCQKKKFSDGNFSTIFDSDAKNNFDAPFHSTRKPKSYIKGKEVKFQQKRSDEIEFENDDDAVEGMKCLDTNAPCYLIKIIHVKITLISILNTLSVIIGLIMHFSTI